MVINLRFPLSHHFQSQEVVIRIKDFRSKGFAAEKMVDQYILAMFNILEILSGMGCVEMTLYPTKYNENLERKFYANLLGGVDDVTSSSYGAVYVSGTPVAFTPSYIASFMSFPHYNDIEDTGLERGIDWDKVACELTGNKKATWPANNGLWASQLLPIYNALFIACCGIWIPTINITAMLKERAHLLYALVTKKKFSL